VIGDEGTPLSGISGIESAAPGDLVFVEDAKNLRAALESRASAVVAPEGIAKQSESKAMLVAAQPRLAFARAAQLLCPAADRRHGIHPSAIVHPTAVLHKNVTADERVVIGENAEIGEGTCIGAGGVIGANVKIGRDCRLYPSLTIYSGVKIGDRVIIHAGVVLGSDGFGYVRDAETGRYEKFPQVGQLEIEDDVEIGANSTIDRGALDMTRIGRGTKIDNLVHIGHNCQIGEDVVIAAQTGLSGSIVIEKNAVLGGQVGIGEHARIGEGVMLGGQGGVLPNKVLRGKGVAFWGTPAQPVREYLKQLAALARLAKKE
jgi:UDP-3-O-[3-hydroxymyristoyl] glucosamine N-acyltransferase